MPSDVPAPSATDRLLAFIAASPSPYHAVANVVEALEATGYDAVDPTGAWPAAGRHYVSRGGAVVVWSSTPGSAASAGFRIVGAHTDSPNLRVKPHPDVATVGWRQLAVDVYGGALVNSWLDRDLGLSGRVALRPTRAGEPDPELRLVLVDRPVLRVPQLAIHLDRDVNERGVVLDKQQHLRPVWGLGTPTPDGFRGFLAEELGVDADRIVGWDVMAHDLTPPGYLGRDRELIVSARLDNLSSCFCGLEALVHAPVDDRSTVAVLALFDHEEVGSDSTTGAGGPLLETVLERIVLSTGGGRDDWHRALAASRCISADMAHAVHPNFLDRYEPADLLVPNGGPAIKLNVNQRYASDDATAAWFASACATAGVPHQVYSHRSNLPCGSTIGPITATRLGIPTVDVGNPQLSMHSARELGGAQDTEHLVAALGVFWS